MRYHRFALWIPLIILSVTDANSAFERLPAGARSHALNGASQFSRYDPFCCEANPSLQGNAEGVCAGFSFSPGLFGLPELQRIEAAVQFPAFIGSVGFLGRTFGFDLCRETTFLAAFSAEMTSDVSIGLSAAWYDLRIAGYGHAGCLGTSLGMTARLADQVHYGFSLRNFNQPTIGRTGEPIKTEILGGVEYLPIPSFLLLIGISKEADVPLTGAIGMEWHVTDYLAVRAGANEGLEEFGIGFGIRAVSCSFDYGVSIHSDLGLTHVLSLGVAFP